LTWDQQNAIREAREQEIERAAREKRDLHKELNEWAERQLQWDRTTEEERIQHLCDEYKQQEAEWRKACRKRDRQRDPQVIDMSAEEQFICDNGGCGGTWGKSDYFSFEFRERQRSDTDKRLVWECKRCGEYHVASRLYSPCGICKKQKFESRYEDCTDSIQPNFIACSNCGAVKKDAKGVVLRDVL
jgi:hypothetical protein